MHALIIDDAAVSNLVVNCLTAVMLIGIVALVGMIVWSVTKSAIAFGKFALHKTRDLLG